MKIDLDEVESFDEVVDVVAERFQRRVRPFLPHLRLLADEQAVGQRLDVGGHDEQTFQRFLQTGQARPDDVRQAVTSSRRVTLTDAL